MLFTTIQTMILSLPITSVIFKVRIRALSIFPTEERRRRDRVERHFVSSEKKYKRISQNLIDGTANLCAKPKILLSLFDCDLYKGTKLFLTGLINAIFVESKRHSERTVTEVIHCYQSNLVS